MTEDRAALPRRIWVLHCPFTKSGVPNVGNFGSTVRPVVILPLETWQKLCAVLPSLAAEQFEVGTYD